MNTLNNQRFQSTEESIQKALFSLLRFKPYNDISIKEICYEAGINRSSFYSHYQDINDLMIKTENSLSEKISTIFNPQIVWNQEVFEKLFQFLLDNKSFYKAYLTTNEQTFMEKADFKKFIEIIKLNNIDSKFPSEEIVYHMAFFAGGIKAMAKSWIQNGCKQTPKEMSKIITNEYKINSRFFDNH